MQVVTHKNCNHCKESKPLVAFHRRCTSEDGHGRTCKFCVSDFNKSYRANHAEKIAAKRRAYWQKADVRKRGVAYQNKRNRARMESLATRPRPTSCEICGGTKKICYDHDHKTSKFRGWLCSRCNLYLGGVKDNIELLNKMITYLVKNGS